MYACALRASQNRKDGSVWRAGNIILPQRGGIQTFSPLTLLIYDFDLRATHARKLLPAALASVSFGFVLVRVRVRLDNHGAHRAPQNDSCTS